MANIKKNKPKFFDDGPSAMTDSRAMDDSSTIIQLFQKANKRVLRLFDAKQYDDNNEDQNHTFGIEVLNKSDSETENDVDDENDNIEIPETQSQEPESTQPHSVYQQSRRDGIKSLNVKNLSPIDICTISSEGSNSRSISNVETFKEPTARSPIHKKSGIQKPNISLRRSVFKPNVVPDFENFVCSTPRNGEPRQLFQDSITMSPIRNNISPSRPEKNADSLKVRNLSELQASKFNKSDEGNVCNEERRKSIHGPAENAFKIPPAKSSDFVARRISVDSVISKKSKPSTIGEIEPALLQQYDNYVTKTPTKRSTSRLSNVSVSPVSNSSNRIQQVSINMDIDNNDIINNQSSRRKSINQTDYRTMNMAETPVQSNVTAHNRDSMIRMKNKLAICETDDEDEEADMNEIEAMDEDIDVYEEEVMYEEQIAEVEIISAPIYETPKKSQFKRPGTPLKIAIMNTHEIRKNPIRLERITSSSDNDMSNNVSPSLLASFRNLPLKRKSNEKVMDTVDFEITSSQAEEALLGMPKKKRKKGKVVKNNQKEYVQLVTELQKKNKIKSLDTTVKKRTLYCRESFTSPQTSHNTRSAKNSLLTSAKETNKSASDVELDTEMSRIHSSFQQPEKEQKKSPLKKSVAANTSESKVVTRSNRKADLLDEQTDCSEEEPEAEVIVTNKKTPKHKKQENEEIHLEPISNNKSKKSHKQQEVDAIRKKISYRKVSTESDSSQEQEPVTNIVKKKNSNQLKGREPEVDRHKKSTYRKPISDESDSSQEPAPIDEAARKKTTKQKETQDTGNRKKKSTHRKPISDESDSSQEPAPIVEAARKKTNKQQKIREPEVDHHKKSTHSDHNSDNSDSSQEPAPIVEAVRKKTNKQQKIREPEVDRHKKSPHRKPTSDESDSSQEPEPIVEAARKKTTKQQKIREPEVERLKKSTHSDHNSDNSDSSQEPAPIVEAVRKKTNKQQKIREPEVDHHKKSTHRKPTSDESDSSQEPEPIVEVARKKTTKQKETREPIVEAVRKKTTKQKKGSPTKKKSILIQNNEMSFRSFDSEAESTEEQEPFDAPAVHKSSKKKLIEPSEKMLNVKEKFNLVMYGKPSPLCKKKFSRIVVTAGSDSEDEYVVGQHKKQSKVIEPTLPVFKVPAVPERKLTMKQKAISRELEGLRIKCDRELMSEFDEGIEINDDDDDHSNSPGIYPNVYRVANCERKLRVRKLYSRPYWMNGEHQYGIRYTTLNTTEEIVKCKFNKKQSKKNTNFLENCLNIEDHQQLIDNKASEYASRVKNARASSKEPRKQKKQINDSGSTDYGGSTSSANQFVSSSNQQMPTISEYSNSITEEAVSYANLMTRFQEYGKHGISNTSEASTSTKVHSNFVDMAQMEDLNFTECGDGILFGKYGNAANSGVIQFLEGKKRDRAKSKRSDIKLFLISGELEVTVATEIHILKPMGFMVIHCGTEYEMRNSYKGVSMVFFMRGDSEQVSTSSSSGNSPTKKKTS